MKRKPRPVTRDDIEAFEKQYPLYRGIGRLMLREGIWILVESKRERESICGGSRAHQNVHSTRMHQAANGTRHCNDISVSAPGACPR
ncbi:hypothetical protein FGU65_03760 [Methanoculleus sp. FWC-SCC1]|uniref:Uncharacterized protein n=1 Tax=Methanoculleus frigidifontis TaxID=2584085 RepID=A0ABT8M7V4_9EURY|nr:hypothetical protein [Methanoculleus sp. FWC-SCC1]